MEGRGRGSRGKRRGNPKRGTEKIKKKSLIRKMIFPIYHIDTKNHGWVNFKNFIYSLILIVFILYIDGWDRGRNIVVSMVSKIKNKLI